MTANESEYRKSNAPTKITKAADGGVIYADVEVSRETWSAIVAQAHQAMAVRGESAGTAFWDSVYEHIAVVPNVVVDGEVKGPDDLLEDGGPRPETGAA